MDKWTEIRSAYLVAKLGTVSAAANILNVHRATINRHIDSLEQTLGTKLFQRHARGYTPTEAGLDLLETAGRAEEMFDSLQGRTRGRSGQLSGELIVTALPWVATLLMPAFVKFHTTYPDVKLQFDANTRLARLEYGEAHVALRAGQKPEEPDYVVLPFQKVRFTLYAHKSYIARYGKPDGLDDLDGHWFVGSLKKGRREPYTEWMRTHISPKSMALYTQHPKVVFDAVSAGLGLGFLDENYATNYEGLVQVVAPKDEWSGNLWIVSHVDLYRTIKVQEFVRYLKAIVSEKN